MNDKGNIYLIEALEKENFKLTDIETKAVKFTDKLPQLFKMIPADRIDEVKAMNKEERIEVYNNLLCDKGEK